MTRKQPTAQPQPQLRSTPDVLYFPATIRVAPDIAGEAGKKRTIEPDGDGRIPVCLSSEYEVERMDWWTGERYLEVLDHGAESVDLSRAELGGGLSLLACHDSYDLGAFLGKVEDLAVDKDRKLRGWMRFSSSAAAQQARQDVVDELLTSVSIGYRVSDFEETEDKTSGRITRRYKNWTPHELSLVPVPADPTVGAGRSQAHQRQPLPPREPRAVAAAPAAPVQDPAPTRQETAMPEPVATAPAPAGAGAAVTVGDSAEITKRMHDIAALAREHKCEDKLPEWIEKNLDLSAVRGAINTILADRLKNPVRTGALVELDEKDAKRYSYARAFLGQAPDANLRQAFGGGLEAEVAEEIKRAHPHLSHRGFLFPSMLRKKDPETQQRAGLDSATSTKGTELKFTQPGEFIDLLRNRSIVIQAGARILSGLVGPVSFPRQTGAGTASWIAENPGSDTSTSNLTLDTVSLAMKTLMSVTTISKQLLLAAASGNVDAEQMVRADLAAIFALAIDSAGLKGGGSNQPSGILSHTGIGSITIGADGGALTYAKIVDLETTVANVNGDVGLMSYVTTPTQRGKLKKLYNVNTTYGTEPIWGSQPDGFGIPQGVLNGYRAFATNQTPSNLTKGTATTICSALIYGAFEELIIGEWGAFEAMVDPYTLAAQGLVRVVGMQLADIALRRYQAFAAVQDAI